MAEPEVLVEFNPGDGFGTVTLNRASKLNSLNVNMIRLLHGAADEIDERAGKIGCVVVAGAGGKAFCCGGDVNDVRAEALAGGSLPADFFFEEYAMVHRFATLFERTGCCQVSLWDGFVMGGGVGTSVHGPFRVATEKTVFAMPEMAIGLFPDVGAMHVLSRLKIGMGAGIYMCVSGSRLTAWDCMRAGLATHFVPSASIPKLRALLSSRCAAGITGAAAMALCDEILKEVGAGATPPTKGAVLTDENMAVINACFSASAIEDIAARLRAHPGAFAAATHETLIKSCSPTSCKVTLRAFKEFSREGSTIGDVLQTEYRLACRFTMRPQPLSDFHEGVRAVLVDKDRKQRWRPGWDELEQITDESVAVYFSPLEPGHRRGELTLSSTAWKKSERKPFPDVILRARL